MTFSTLAQLSDAPHGWLTQRMLSTLTANAEWVLWLLAGLSVLSIAVMLERGIYFSTHRLTNPEHVLLALVKGDYLAVQRAIANTRGMEAAILREGLAVAIPAVVAYNVALDLQVCPPSYAHSVPRARESDAPHPSAMGRLHQRFPRDRRVAGADGDSPDGAQVRV